MPNEWGKNLRENEPSSLKKSKLILLESQEQELNPQHPGVLLILLQDAKTTLLQMPIK